MGYNFYKLAMYRKRKNLTQEEAAKILNISRNTLIMYEKGKLDIPLTVFIKMSELYEFDVFDILGVNDAKLDNAVEHYYMIKAHVTHVIRQEVNVNKMIYGEEMYSQDYYAKRYLKLLNNKLASDIYNYHPEVRAEAEKDRGNIPIFVEEKK